MKTTCFGLILFCAFSSFLKGQCLSGNCQNGTGKYRFQNGALYEGEMAFGRLNGNGKLHYANGDLYEGHWSMNQREGQGKIVTHDGFTYEGNFRHNQLDGEVNVYDPEGGKFAGQWEEGKAIGVGQYTSADGRTEKGSWIDSHFHPENTSARPAMQEFMADCNLVPCSSGKGRMVLQDGAEYTGHFLNALPDGEGECHYANGDKYAGEWVEGMPEGKGTYTYANGVKLEGDWKSGKLIRQASADHTHYAEGVNIYALIVGASRYDHFESLKYTDDDAYRIYAFLRSPEGGAVPEDHIRLLIDESAIAENIYHSLDEIIAMAGPEDEVLVYLAGHGYQGFFVPTDSDGYHHRLEYEEIRSRLADCPAHQKLVIADACYSGSLLAAKAPVFESVDLFYKKLAASGGGTAFLLSSKSEEYSLESQGLRQGIFSHYLIRGLEGEADRNKDKMVTLDELYSFVYEKVRAYSQNMQTPVLAGDADRQMPLASVR
jgi:hypothetical protein